MDIDHVVQRGGPLGFLPDLTDQHLARHDMALVPQEVFEDLELHDCQRNGLLSADDGALDQVHVEVGQFQLQGLVAPAPPQQGPDPGRQLGEGKGLTR